MMAEVKGSKDGKEAGYLINCPQMTTPGQKIYDLFGTSLVGVALPAVIGGKMISEGTQKGILFAEQLDPDVFLKKMKATGYPYEWTVAEI